MQKTDKEIKAVPLMRKDIKYTQGVQIEEAVEIIRHCMFRDEEMEIRERTIRNPQEFHDVYMDWISYWNYERCLSEFHAFTKKESFYYYGFCEACNSPQPFVVDYRFANEENGIKKINWRERLVCPNCRCNSRQRYSIRQILEAHTEGKKILLYEQNSDVYRNISKEISQIEAFEYAGEGIVGNAINGIPVQDVCALDYESESFDLIMANDIFECVYDYDNAFKEARRVLRPGGKLVFTVPFDGNSDCTVRRVERDNDNIIYTAEKLYRGNAVPGMESLVICQIFGWDVVDSLRKAGFRDAYGKVYYGVKKAYMGYLPLYLEAVK